MSARRARVLLQAAMGLPRAGIGQIAGLGLALAGLAGCDAVPAQPGQRAAPHPARSTLLVGAAASFRGVAQALAVRHEAAHPGSRVRVVGAGSQALVRRALDLSEPFEVLLLADESLFQTLLEPAWTDSHENVASDRLVLARAPVATGAVPRRDDWPDLLLRQDVRVGMADPDRAPLGYRTELAWQLAEAHHGRPGLARSLRAKVGNRHLWPDATALLAPLETGAIDYAFVYRASAVAARLPFTELAPEVHLGDPAFASAYAMASVAVAGTRPGSQVSRRGGLITYSAGLARGASRAALEYLASLRSDAGQRVVAAHGFTPRPNRPAPE